MEWNCCAVGPAECQYTTVVSAVTRFAANVHTYVCVVKKMFARIVQVKSGGERGYAKNVRIRRSQQTMD
jgi:hypothetical protein